MEFLKFDDGLVVLIQAEELIGNGLPENFYRYGYYDRYGNAVTGLIYYGWPFYVPFSGVQLPDFESGLVLAVKRDEGDAERLFRFGVIDRTGKEILPFGEPTDREDFIVAPYRLRVLGDVFCCRGGDMVEIRSLTKTEPTYFHLNTLFMVGTPILCTAKKLWTI